jgi:hypothetical protein
MTNSDRFLLRIGVMLANGIPEERALRALNRGLILTPVLMALLSAEAILQFVGVISVGPVLAGCCIALAVFCGISVHRILRLRKRLSAKLKNRGHL